jgi:hypothetical protein
MEAGFLKAAAAVIGLLALVALGSYYYLFNLYMPH